MLVTPGCQGMGLLRCKGRYFRFAVSVSTVLKRTLRCRVPVLIDGSPARVLGLGRINKGTQDMGGVGARGPTPAACRARGVWECGRDRPGRASRCGASTHFTPCRGTVARYGTVWLLTRWVHRNLRASPSLRHVIVRTDRTMSCYSGECTFPTFHVPYLGIFIPWLDLALLPSSRNASLSFSLPLSRCWYILPLPSGGRPIPASLAVWVTTATAGTNKCTGRVGNETRTEQLH